MVMRHPAVLECAVVSMPDDSGASARGVRDAAGRHGRRRGRDHRVLPGADGALQVPGGRRVGDCRRRPPARCRSTCSASTSGPGRRRASGRPVAPGGGAGVDSRPGPRTPGTNGVTATDRARHGRLARYRQGDGRRVRGRRVAGGGRGARPRRDGRTRVPRRAPRGHGPRERPRGGRRGARDRRRRARLPGEQRGLDPRRGGGGRGPRPRPASVRDQPLRGGRGDAGGTPRDAPGRLRRGGRRLLPRGPDPGAAHGDVRRVEAGPGGGPRGAGPRAGAGRRAGGADRGGVVRNRPRALHDRERVRRRAGVALRRCQDGCPRGRSAGSAEECGLEAREVAAAIVAAVEDDGAPFRSVLADPRLAVIAPDAAGDGERHEQARRLFDVAPTTTGRPR